MRFGVVSCTGLNSVSLPQVHVYLGPVNVTLFGNRVYAGDQATIRSQEWAIIQ